MRVIVKDIHANEVGSYTMPNIPRKGESLILLDRQTLRALPPRLGPPCYDVFAVVWHLGDEPFVVVHGKLVEPVKDEDKEDDSPWSEDH